VAALSEPSAAEFSANTLGLQKTIDEAAKTGPVNPLVAQALKAQQLNSLATRRMPTRSCWRSTTNRRNWITRNEEALRQFFQSDGKPTNPSMAEVEHLLNRRSGQQLSQPAQTKWMPCR